MNERTISDADQGVPRTATPPPQDNYGATCADAGTGSTVPLSNRRSVAARDVYQVVHLIGKGGMGSVSLAQDVRLRRWVALKRLSEQYAHDSRLLARFHTEAQSVAALSHFHIVQVYAMDEDDEGPYIAMEYVAGPGKVAREGWPGNLPPPPMDLEDMVKTQGVLKVAEAAKLGIKLCSAVGYAHKRGVIHRDIKPANILLNEEGEPKLADFGLARQVNAQHEGMTMAGAQLLTLGYGAPEQETDASRVDERADLYALGATLWFAITGQNPRFFRESEVPGPLRPILSKALEKDREKRFQSAAEFEQALSKLDPRARFVPQATAIDGLLPGCCPKCGHQHDLGDKASAKRKFCESCGTALLEPCLKCGAENGVWAKFCGPCGADLNTTLNAEIERLQAERDRFEVCHKSYQFEEAIEILTPMAAVKHPRLKVFHDWAAEFLPRVRAEFEAAQQQRDEALQKAQSLATMCEYRDVFPVLENVPKPLWTPTMEKLHRVSRELYTRASQLRKEVADQIAAKDYDTLKAKVLELLKINPNDAEVQKLLQQLEKREERLREASWQAVRRHPTVRNCQEYIANYPAGPHVSQVQALLAPLLRDSLVDRPRDATVRQQYVAIRTPQLQKLDEKLARQGCQIVDAIGGALAGAVLGALVGGVGGWIGGILGGVIAGVALGIVLENKA